MRRLFLKRFSKTSDGTWGVLLSDDGHPLFFTGEIPDTFLRPGVYVCKLQTHYGKTESYPAYEITGVIGHKDVEIHIGNVPTRDLKGCVALGMQGGQRQDQWGVWLSTVAHDLFLHFLDNVPEFELAIKDLV
jgi:hypothetical protein